MSEGVDDFLPPEPFEFDWSPILDRVQMTVRAAIRDNKNVGNTLTFIEGEKWATELSAAVVREVRSMLQEQTP